MTVRTAFLAVATLLPRGVFAADSSITLHVPFTFVVGGKTMPAGAYTVETDGAVVSVRGITGGALIASGPNAPGHSSEPGLVFTKRGNTAYLVGVRTADDSRAVGPQGLQPR